MLTLTTEQRQYTTYILADAATDTCLEVVPERGGIVTRWQVQGREVLYLDRDRFADPNLSIRGGIPILFPICGNLPDNTYSYQGQHYTLKQHGFARDLPWQVSDRHPTDGIELTLTSSDQTRAVYPFDFHITFNYRLQGNDLLIQQQFINQSPEPMPFSTGLHPYFTVADKQQLQFDIPATQFTHQTDQTQHPFAGSFDFEQDEIDVAFRQVTRADATVVERAMREEGGTEERGMGKNVAGSDRTLILSYDTLYPTLVFWTIRGKDYYCLEPWSAPRNALNSGEDLTWLAAGTHLDTWVKLTAR